MSGRDFPKLQRKFAQCSGDHLCTERSADSKTALKRAGEMPSSSDAMLHKVCPSWSGGKASAVDSKRSSNAVMRLAKLTGPPLLAASMLIPFLLAAQRMIITSSAHKVGAVSHARATIAASATCDKGRKSFAKAQRRVVSACRMGRSS
jgi:hypothetical protein